MFIPLLLLRVTAIEKTTILLRVTAIKKTIILSRVTAIEKIIIIKIYDEQKKHVIKNFGD